MSIPSYPYPQFLPQNAAAVTKDNTLVNQLYYLLQALFLRTGGNGGIVQTVGTPISATGTTQAAATLLSNDFNFITTGTGGVRLPNVQPGQSIYVFNATTATINVYPSTGGTINSLGVNVPFPLVAGFGQIFVCVSANSSGASTFNLFLPSLPLTTLTAANTTFFVRTDGNDSNSGLVNSPSGAFLTLQGAYDYIRGNYILGPAIPPARVGPGITISVQPGTYVGSLVAGGPLLGQTDPSQFLIFGPPTAIIDGTGGPAALYFYYGALASADGGITLQSTTSNSTYCFGAVLELSNVTFGSAGPTNVHISAHDGGIISLNANYSIAAGTQQAHYRSTGTSLIYNATTITVTITGTPTFTQAFANVSGNGVLQIASATTTFSGAATGPRFQIGSGGAGAGPGGVIDTSGTFASDQNYFPGNSAGVANAPGSYNDKFFAGTIATTDGITAASLAASGQAGIGYGPAGAGTGGSVIQGVSKSTAVTLNKITGLITTSCAALAGGAAVAFVVNNSSVAVRDVIVLNIQGGTASSGTYEFAVTQVNNGSFVIYLINVSGGSLSEAVQFNFAVIKGTAT